MKPLMTLLPLVTFLSVFAGVPSYLPQDQRYEKAITTPSAYLGYRVGERHLTHAELSGYLRQLVRESDRIEILDYGRTHGHRPLFQLLISSPSNLARKDQLRDQHLQLSQPERSGQMDLSQMPVVVNLNYGVHGNEASASNSAVVIAYYLAAAEGEAIEALLDKTIILLDPCLNPDGFDQFANWVNSRVGRNPNPDPNALEHLEPSPDGRTNYYWFDLNRDYMLLTQPESQGRMALYHQWMPNLLMDFHEMETHSTYFFQPGVPSRNNPLTPQSVFDLTTTISHYFSDALDATGSLYFTEERFDDFYMGKGSTIADLKGAIGILLEQASARGQVQESAHGLLTFEMAIQNQVTISLAALKASRELHGQLLEHMRTFFRDSLDKGRAANYAGYRFASPGDPARAREFVKILRAHQIEVHPTDGEEAWYVPVAQPHYLYLQALIEQRTEFEESIFYDITAWTLPLAYNLEWDKLDQAPNRGQVRSLEANLEKSSLGYLIDWAGINAPRILFDLLEEGVLVKVAKEPFTLKGESFGYGTLFIPMNLQKGKAETVYSLLKSATEEGQVRVASVDSFRTESGIHLGSNSMVPLARPRILMPVGERLYNVEAGTAWHLIDVLHDYPVTLDAIQRNWK